MRKFFRGVKPPITTEKIREYLKNLKNNYCIDYYKLALSSLKAYFRDFKKLGNLVESFKFPSKPFRPKIIPSKKAIQKFYDARTENRMCAIFMTFATSGLRHGELFSLTVQDVNFQKRMIIPNNHKGTTKKSWITFYNEETEKILNEYLPERPQRGNKLFPISSRDFKAMWKEASKNSVVHITPKVLRDWFCCEMGELGMQDRYVDAFCGRVPKSVLARHYTDYSPRKLKRIYDRASLMVLRIDAGLKLYPEISFNMKSPNQ